MIPESESVLLRRFAKSRDAEAFSEIVRLHAGMVYGVCLRILTDRDKAADATQDTFFQLLRSGGEISSSLPGWLHRVAAGKATDVIRRDCLRRQKESQYADNSIREVRDWKEMSQYVDEELDKLDDTYRDILILRFFEGLSMSQIAAKTGISQPTVSRKINSGVTKLRKRLHKRGLIFTVITLSTLLTENAVEAAPMFVVRELGKMALVGGQVTASGLLTATKVKVIAAVTTAVIGIGGVVTYEHANNKVDDLPLAGIMNLSPEEQVPGDMEKVPAVLSESFDDDNFEDLQLAGEPQAGDITDAMFALEPAENIEAIDANMEAGGGPDEGAKGRARSNRRYRGRKPILNVGKALPDLKKLGLRINSNEIADKRILICFWDVRQKYSRQSVMRLRKYSKVLDRKGVYVILVDLSMVDNRSLNSWTRKNKIPFPMVRARGGFGQVWWNWRVGTVPWLILTDRDHVVADAGFKLNQLSKKIKD